MEGQIINLSIGLLILMAVNIALGSLGAIFVKRFDWRRLFQGIAKGLIIVGCFAATYFVGYLNPDIIVLNIGELDANVMTALGVIILAGYFHYAKQVLEKLLALLRIDLDGIKRPRNRRNPPD